MHRHGPTCLPGPVTRFRGWWNDPVFDTIHRESSIMDSRKPSAMKDPGPDAKQSDRPIRTDLVERVRREIAAGIYDTPEKWEAALDRLMSRLEDNEESH